MTLRSCNRSGSDGSVENKFEDVQEMYAYSQKGLQEIRSPEALEALINSLKPTPEKERLTVDCLKRTYKVDKLPDDPNAPASLCSPDR
jgi:hypothetical protein